MSGADLFWLLPFITLAAGSLVVLLAAAFLRRLGAAALVSTAAVALAIVFACLGWSRAPGSVGSQLSFDRFTVFGVVLILAATLVVVIASWSVLRRRQVEGGDYFFLLLVSALGAVILAASSAFATFFLGLELLSVSLYALIGWKREQGIATEAAIKYLILAGASSAFLLFGLAMIYAATGSMDLFRLAEGGAGAGIVAPLGLAILFVGIGFKLAVVPFHMWTPDVYHGAPAPVTGYIASVSKGAMVVVLVRAFAPALTGWGASSAAAAQGPLSTAFPWSLAVMAAASMFGGNILALRENNVKRILAFSSIAHLGYLLVAFVAAGTEGFRAVAFYLVAYFAATLGAFIVIGELGREDRDADSLEDYEGLAATRPGVAAAFTIMLLSLAGLPLTAGFVGKFLILRAGSGAEMWALAVILVVNSTISIFYYLRIVSPMFRGIGHEAPAVGADRTRLPGAGEPAAGTPGARAPRATVVAALSLAVLSLVVLVLGVYPGPLLDFIGGLAGAAP